MKLFVAVVLTCLGVSYAVTPEDARKVNPDYELVTIPMSYNVAAQNCKSKGKELLEPHNLAEQLKLTTFMTKLDLREVWIGISRQQSPDSPPWIWRYEHNQEIAYNQYWNDGEPNNVDGPEQCIENTNIGNKKKWNDIKCSKTLMSICVKKGYNPEKK